MPQATRSHADLVAGAAACIRHCVRAATHTFLSRCLENRYQEQVLWDNRCSDIMYNTTLVLTNGVPILPSFYPLRCLENRYQEQVEAANAAGDWRCPRCRGECNCSNCRKASLSARGCSLGLEKQSKKLRQTGRAPAVQPAMQHNAWLAAQRGAATVQPGPVPAWRCRATCPCLPAIAAVQKRGMEATGQLANIAKKAGFGSGTCRLGLCSSRQEAADKLTLQPAHVRGRHRWHAPLAGPLWLPPRSHQQHTPHAPNPYAFGWQLPTRAPTCGPCCHLPSPDTAVRDLLERNPNAKAIQLPRAPSGGAGADAEAGEAAGEGAGGSQPAGAAGAARKRAPRRKPADAAAAEQELLDDDALPPREQPMPVGCPLTFRVLFGTRAAC